MNNFSIFEILILLSVWVIGYSLLFFKSYFSKKGENTATKEDIGSITQIVEEIKNNNSKELEKIKTELSLIVIKSSKQYERRLIAIEEIYNKLSKLKYCFADIVHTMRISSSDRSVKDIEKIKKFEMDYNDFTEYYYSKRLFIDYEFQKYLDAVVAKMGFIINDYANIDLQGFDSASKGEILKKNYEDVNKNLPAAFNALESEFKKLLNS